MEEKSEKIEKLETVKDIIRLARTSFRECADCASKPGSPTLCESCIWNRDTIFALGNLILNILDKGIDHIEEKWWRINLNPHPVNNQSTRDLTNN